MSFNCLVIVELGCVSWRHIRALRSLCCLLLTKVVSCDVLPSFSTYGVIINGNFLCRVAGMRSLPSAGYSPLQVLNVYVLYNMSVSYFTL